MKRVPHPPALSATIVFNPDPAPGEPQADVFYSAPDDVSLDELRACLARWAQSLTVAVWKSRARQDRERAA